MTDQRKTAAKKTPAAKKKATAAKKKTATTAARPARQSSVAAAAERASGERARRRSTPLITGSAETGGPAVRRPAPAKTSARKASAKKSSPTKTAPTKTAPTKTAPTKTAPAKKAPAKKATPTKATASPRRRTTPSTTAPQASKSTKPTLRVVEGGSATPTPKKRPKRSDISRSARRTTSSVVPAEPTTTVEERPSSGTALAPGFAELLSVALSAGQVASRTVGGAVSTAAGEEWERRFADVLAFLRRRVQGDYAVDDFGFDEDFTIHTAFPVLRLLKDKWFRVEVRGIENIPAEGGALVVSNHSGTVAIDSLITQLAIYDAHPQSRFLRMLGADLVFQLPVVGDFARKTGATLATNPDAERLMASGELVGVWPEGFKGVGKPFRERYKLQRFGRGGFVSAAIRSEVPIIPCSVVGAEEIYPMIGNLKTVARLLGAPYAPVTPFFPLLGPLGLIPLPSKWIIEFSPAVDTASLGPAAAEDPMLVFDLTDQVRETIQQTLYSVLMTRRSVFF